MAGDVFKLGVVKFGCIGAAPLLDLIFDERADRKDLEVRVFTSGAKLDPDSCVGPTQMVIEYKPDLVLSVSPNAALKGPTKSREMLHEAEKERQVAQLKSSGSQRSPGLFKRILSFFGFSSYESESGHGDRTE